MDMGYLTLPPEILSEIFRHAKPKREPPHVLPLEVVLSHVSTDWRNAVLSDARVWSTINIYSPKSISRAKAYLARSGTTISLNVRVDIYDHDRKARNPSMTDSFKQKIGSFLRSCIGRCKTLLVFTYSEATATPIVESLSTSTAPLLERLRINSSRFHQLFPQHPPLATGAILQGGAPNLRFLEIECLRMFPPLDTLETLHLHNLDPTWFNYDKFKALAPSLQHVKYLSIEPQGIISDWPLDSPGATIALKNLRALKLSDTYPGLLVKFLLTIHSPRLESLTLIADTTSFDQLFDSPQFDGPTPKFPQLRYLTLESYNMRSLNRFAKAFPTVTHFYISEALILRLNHFKDSLSSAPPLWPKLEILALTAKSDRRLTSLKEALCEIVLKRGEMKVGFKTFLSDGDIIDFLKGSDMLTENLVLETMDTDNFREPWWLLAHESHPDSIGLS